MLLRRVFVASCYENWTKMKNQDPFVMCRGLIRRSECRRLNRTGMPDRVGSHDPERARMKNMMPETISRG
jgi:hypothetical protein